MADVSFSHAASAYRGMNKLGGANATQEASKSLQQGIGSIDSGKNAGGSDFMELISQALRESGAAGYKSEAVSAQGLANKAQLHDVVTAVSNAELTLNTVVAVRDRVINAYQDILKMPI